MDDDELTLHEPYDNGWRQGTFDKCNGRPRKTFEGCEVTIYNVIYIDGYNDAYNSNEVRINAD